MKFAFKIPSKRIEKISRGTNAKFANLSKFSHNIYHTPQLLEFVEIPKLEFEKKGSGGFGGRE